MQQAINKLAALVEQARNTATENLADWKIAIKAIDKFASNKFGSVEEPSILDLEEIYDEVACGHCHLPNRIYGRDTPLFNAIYCNLCNGITSLRRLLTSKANDNILENFGVEYDKPRNGHKFIFKGLVEKIKRHKTPARVRAVFEARALAGANCDECNEALPIVRSMKGEWFVDHKFSDQMENYADKQYSLDPANYQLLCASCSSTDRQVEILAN